MALIWVRLCIIAFIFIGTLLSQPHLKENHINKIYILLIICFTGLSNIHATSMGFENSGATSGSPVKYSGDVANPVKIQISGNAWIVADDAPNTIAQSGSDFMRLEDGSTLLIEKHDALAFNAHSFAISRVKVGDENKTITVSFFYRSLNNGFSPFTITLDGSEVTENNTFRTIDRAYLNSVGVDVDLSNIDFLSVSASDDIAFDNFVMESLSAAPEPSAYALMLIGLGGLLVLKRRQNTNCAA